MSDDRADVLARWTSAAESGTFEEALVVLDEIVAVLEGGRRGLDETVAAYEIGVRVSLRCEELLTGAELRVSQIAVDARAHSTVTTALLDAEDDDEDVDVPSARFPAYSPDSEPPF